MITDVQISNIRLKLVAGPIAATLIGLASASTFAQTAFTTIDVIGAGTGAQQGTVVTAVDSAGDIAGIYIDTNNVLHCFVQPAGGSISNCDVSSTGSSAGEGTFPTTINSSGVVAGSYVDGSQISHGFVRAANGTITKFDAPLASQAAHRGTTVLSINDSGVIIGTYTTGTYSTTSTYGGFMRSADGSTFTTINDPNAGTGEDANGKKEGTIPVVMNASGVVAGYYIDSTSVQHGFVRSAGGTFTAIDPTGVGTCVNQNNGSKFGGTTASGIDAAGDVGGTYLDASCEQHGFIRNSSGTITSFDVPGAGTSPCTTGGGSGQKICGTFLVLSDAVGDLTGSYMDGNGTIHGFLRPEATGIFTSFEDPSAYTSGSLNGTVGITINSQTSGTEIAGTYLDTNSVLHGFEYIPALTATTTTLTPVPTPNPSVYQEPVTLTASVTSSGGSPANGEKVTFMSGSTSLGTAQLTSGIASLTTTDLPTGTDSIAAVYNGDSNFAGSTSTAVSQTVNKASSSTTLTSSPNPSASGQSVTLTANISGQFSGVATGTVTFDNGNTSLGTVSVSGNSASLASPSLPVGTDSITAVYSGDGNFTGNTSNAVSQVVSSETQTATPTFSPIAGTYSSMQTVTLSDATAGATIYYTTNGTTPNTSSTVYSGPVTVTASETIEASAAASGYSASNVATGAYTIQASGFTLSPSPTLVSIAQGSSATASITVTDLAGFSGSVTLSVSGLPSNVSAATATTSPTGTQEIVLSAGSSAAVTSSPITVTITGTSGAVSTSTTIALTITGPVGTIFDNIANVCSPYSQTQPSCGYYPVFGPTGDFAVNLPEYTGAQFTPSAAGVATDARITVVQNAPGPGLGTSGLLNLAIFSDSNGSPGTQISQTVTGLIAPYCCNAAILTGWFTQPVSLSAGVPYWLVVTPGASDTYVGWVVGGLSNVPVVQSLTAGTSPQECNTWCAFAASSIQFAIDSSTTPPPAFMLSASPATLSVGQGASAATTITVTDEGGFSGAVSLAASGLPSGVTASFAAGSAAGTQVMTLSASPSAVVTSTPSIVTIAGTSGSLSSITSIALIVTASGTNVTATPTFSPSAGTYTSAQSVTISDATSGAVIYYTTNGTTPTTSSSVYSSPIAVSSSETIEAIAIASGDSASAVATAAYTINLSNQAATPTFSPAGGAYTSAQSVTISDATPGATIYYTTNGTTPTTSSTVYSTPIAVSSSETVAAIATASGYTTSAVGASAYTIGPIGFQGFVLYSTVGNVGSYSEYPSSLITVNPTTGAQQLVGQSGQSANVAWLTANPVNNVLYGTGLESTDSENTLYTINPASGVISSQVTLSQNVSTIAASPQGTLYGMSGTTLGTINTTTGMFSSVGTVPVPSGYVLQAMTFSPSGTLYAVEETGGGVSFNQQLVTLNPANGATVSNIGNLGTYDIEDIAYAPDGNIYATNFSYTLLKINPQTATTTLIGAGSIGDLDGIAAIALPAAATPAFSPVAGTYTSVQSVTISDATSGATIYYTTNGTSPTASSTKYSGPISVSSSETVQAIAIANGYSMSAAASAAYTINLATNPTPVISSASPAFTNAGGAAFTITVNGSGFIAGSVVYWGTSALATTYLSGNQLTAQVPASDITTGGITVAITVLTPTPGGGTSSPFQFEVDSASGSTTGPTFTSTTATVTAGSSATYPVTLPSNVTGASVTCLNLPAGATCSYSTSTNVLTIATSATTPKGTYQITVVFNETVTVAAAFILLPFLLLPLLILRKELAKRGAWIAVCVALALLASVAFNVGCGGGGSGGGGGGGGGGGTQTQQVTSAGAVSLTVQ